MTTETEARRQIIEALGEIIAKGINQGTSGNVSIRHGDRMLISPSAIPVPEIAPDMIASMDLRGEMTGEWEGPCKPSTEWRFHWKLMASRPDATAIVHAHPPYCTAFSMLRRTIPAAHYMIAAFGGADVRCTGYETFGSVALADEVMEAMRDRTACLIGNHGMVAVGTGIAQAVWRAVELETLARQYHLALLAGDPVILTDGEVAETQRMFADYGQKASKA